MSSSNRSPERAEAMGSEIHLAALLEVAEERALHRAPEFLVEHAEVHLEQPAQRQVVEIERADGAPASVDDGALRVQDATLVLVDADAVPEQPAPGRTARVAHDLHVGFCGQEDAHVDAALRCSGERAHDRTVRHEVGVRDPGRFFRVIELGEVRPRDLVPVF